MSLTPEERSQYRSKRLREGKNRPVSPARATPEMEKPAEVETLNCHCGTHLAGTKSEAMTKSPTREQGRANG